MPKKLDCIKHGCLAEREGCVRCSPDWCRATTFDRSDPRFRAHPRVDRKASPAGSAVQFKRLHPNAVLPTRATPGSAGLDLHACFRAEHYDRARREAVGVWETVGVWGAKGAATGIRVAPGRRFIVPTGWAVAIPHGHEGQVRPRSGLALRHGLTVLNAPGTLDADYRGELNVLMINLGAEPVDIHHGDRIAQLVIAPVAMAGALEVDELPGTGRGGGGFGSTGQ